MSANIIQGIFEQDITIKQVSSVRRLKDFIFLPWKIYKTYPNWSPTLISKEFRRLSKRKNPFFTHSDAALFIAYKLGKPVGRIAAIINNKHEALHHDGAGFFGFFESSEDYYVAKRLLMSAENWCKERGKRSMIGPVNLSIHEEYGLLINGYHEKPYIFMPYNPPYYGSFFERHGYTKLKDMFSYSIDLSKDKDIITNLDAKIQEDTTSPKLTFRRVRSGNIKDTFKIVFNEVFNQEWQQHYGFLPLTEKEVEFRFREYAKWVIPDLVLIGEVDGNTAGCMVLLPNFNQVIHRFNGPLSFLNNLLLNYYKYHIHTVRCVLLQVRKHYRNHGFHLQMIREALKRFDQLGVKSMELGWVSEDHIATRHAIESFGLRPSKTYRLFAKNLPYERLFKLSPAQGNTEQRLPS